MVAAKNEGAEDDEDEDEIDDDDLPLESLYAEASGIYRRLCSDSDGSVEGDKRAEAAARCLTLLEKVGSPFESFTRAVISIQREKKNCRSGPLASPALVSLVLLAQPS